jgi:hypothetical protein
VSQLAGTGVMGLAAFLLLRPYGLMGMAFAVLLSAGSQLLALIAAAAKWFKISPLEFWPFGTRNLRLFLQQIAALRMRAYRSAA